MVVGRVLLRLRHPLHARLRVEKRTATSSGCSGFSSDSWYAIASAAVAVALLNIDNEDNGTFKTRCDFNYSQQPYQRLSRRKDPDDVRHPSPISSSNSLLHRHSKENKNDTNNHQQQDDLPLDEKYKIDWSLVLGEGAYGKVHPARVAATGEKVALKKISKRFTNASSFTSETAALWRIYDNGGHPNISGLRDIYEDYSHFYVILDLARGGELFDHLIKYGQYSERDAARLATEIFSALAFIHNIGVCHCDLKPENILLCSGRRGGETVKIIDFGCANVDERADESPFQSSQSAKNATLSLGTRAYWAPECFGKGAKKTEAMDIWAVGVILFIMLVGAHPFDVKGIKTDSEIEQKIKRNPFPPMHLAAHLSPSARDFIRKLMEPNPDERLTAITALQHPWIRGVTPSTKLIDGSDTKLEMYQDLRNTLATGIFAALVDSEKLKDKETDVDSSADTSSLTHLLKKAFDVFDNKGKGYVTEVDIGRVMAKVTGNKLSLEDEKDLMTAVKRSSSHKSSTGLSLSDFSQLFSRLSHEHHKQGDYLYHIGDTGDAMYFINSGKVEILTKKGHLVSILRHGDFFGEGALIEERNQRFAAARCATPVDVIKVSREDFNRYISSSPETKLSIKKKWKARTLSQAKQLIRLQTNLTRKHLTAGDIVYREGDIGESMYVVDEGGGTLEVRHGDKTLHYLKEGDSFGESSLLFQRPRSSTVVCASSDCYLHEMRSSDFYDMLDSDPLSAKALREMCRNRMFQRATKSYLLKQNSGLSNEDLVTAFRDADKDKSGSLSFQEVQDLFINMGHNSEIPEDDVIEYFKSLDLDEDGQIRLEEFQRVFKGIHQ